MLLFFLQPWPIFVLPWYLSPRAEDKSVIVWWEKRRIPYNVILCVVCFGFYLSWKDSGIVVITWTVVQIMANVWYTGGWIVELMLKAIHKGRLRLFGPIALAAGTLFSIVFAAFCLVYFTLLNDAYSSNS